MRLLVVEDEQKVARFIKQGMEEEGYAVDVAADGEAGLLMALDEGSLPVTMRSGSSSLS